MNVTILNYESYLDRIGGGFTFLRNFLTGFTVSDDAEVCFVPNPMQAPIEQLLEVGKPIVLRLDNIPEEKNNRGTAASKLRRVIPLAKTIIYQSKWSREKYREFCELNDVSRTSDEEVIYNGADTKVFHPGSGDRNRYLFVHSKGDNKRWPEAQEIFRRLYYQNRKATLHLIGNFADETREYNFGFYNGEPYQWYGVQDARATADIMRTCGSIIYPAFADSCPNTLIEALNCGLTPVGVNPYGGQAEVLDLFRQAPVIFTLPYMLSQYEQVFLRYVRA